VNRLQSKTDEPYWDAMIQTMDFIQTLDSQDGSLITFLKTHRPDLWKRHEQIEGYVEKIWSKSTQGQDVLPLFLKALSRWKALWIQSYLAYTGKDGSKDAL
jgi:hypothetical protein